MSAPASQAVFLAPHNDDETLFGAFTLLRERPRVVTVLRSFIQQERGHGIAYEEREAETRAALAVLGITHWEQWEYPDSNPSWSEISERLGAIDADRFYAPAIEHGGNAHHNALGGIAGEIWPGRVTFYTTYTGRGRTTTRSPVRWEHPWLALKLQALACYESQMRVPATSTATHFFGPHREYYADERVVSDMVNRLRDVAYRSYVHLCSRPRRHATE